MLFSSMVFIWIFLPMVIGINYLINILVKKKADRIHAKNVFLLIASLVFYAWGSTYFLLIMITSIVLNFVFGYLIFKLPKNATIRRKLLLFFAVVSNILILIYFKYFNMIIVLVEQSMVRYDSITNLLQHVIAMERTHAMPFKDVVLPIGISFFTFQAMSYVIDVYRDAAPVQKNIFDFGLYVALFPQLIAGPIVRYADVAKDINGRVENHTKFAYGVKRFCYGLGKKVIIANTLASIVDSVWALELTNLGATLSWFTAICYALQIYYDFSGYSDMAIGLGKIFGFTFKENFNYPYVENSITGFWRSWHISLSSWFKEYVYIPLGGNRCGLFRTCVNIFIVFLLTGIWHGANFTFITWGVYYAVIEIAEKLFLLDILKKNKFKFLNWLYTFIIVVVLFVIFRAPNMNDASTFVGQMFSLKSSYSIFTYLSLKVIIIFVSAILFMGTIQKPLAKLYKLVKDNAFIRILDILVQMSLLIISISYIVSGTYNPFIYFQF